MAIESLVQGNGDAAYYPTHNSCPVYIQLTLDGWTKNVLLFYVLWSYFGRIENKTHLLDTQYNLQ